MGQPGAEAVLTQAPPKDVYLFPFVFEVEAGHAV